MVESGRTRELTVFVINLAVFRLLRLFLFFKTDPV